MVDICEVIVALATAAHTMSRQDETVGLAGQMGDAESIMSEPPRTVVIGDIHGELAQLEVLLSRLPPLTADDTLLFLGDYVDRGPRSAQVIEFLRFQLPASTPARVVCLRGNHEDAWLQVARRGFPQFILPRANGCRECMRSFTGNEKEPSGEAMRLENEALFSGSFLPDDVVSWMTSLPRWYEDPHAIYVHAGLPRAKGRWLHPSEVEDQRPLVWSRSAEFFNEYQGKQVICGHTNPSLLPQDLSRYTPDDPKDLWARGSVIVVDTGCGKGGFLTALVLPQMLVYESRSCPAPVNTGPD